MHHLFFVLFIVPPIIGLCAASCLVACKLHVCLTSLLSRVVQAVGSIVSDGRLLMMLLVQALFEGALLVFVTFWVPALIGSTVSCASRVFSYLPCHSPIVAHSSVVCWKCTFGRVFCFQHDVVVQSCRLCRGSARSFFVLATHTQQ